MSLESVTKEWMQQLNKVGGLYAMAEMMKNGGWQVYTANFSRIYYAIKLAEAAPFSGAAGGGAVAAGVIPIIVAAGVWVALGSGYYEAREIVKKENMMSGFAQGFVCGLLRWTYNQTLDKFKMSHLRINTFHEATDYDRVDSYMEGLSTGFIAGQAMPLEGKKAYLKKMRKIAGIPTPTAEEWRRNRRVQIDYVITLATLATTNGLIKAE
ncbi:MAG: hypothetical protein HC846_01995 [Blastocatellia bacterium]|nr:hypothetical protein [Blastocatellia bacterium]